MRRVVEPELLDELPSADAQAIRSRGDLRRLNFLMGHAGLLARALDCQLEAKAFRSRPLRLVELGAGDGTLLLRLARRWPVRAVSVEATLLDRQNVVSEETRRAFAALHCSVVSVSADVSVWLEQPSAVVMLANLFLHHFGDGQLAAMFRLAAARTNLFLGCEPRRSRHALRTSRSLALLGCNAVTRHDAVASVRAGFTGRELSALWPTDDHWTLTEQPAGWFSHGFVAKRNA